MKVKNKSKQRIWIGAKVIEPGDTVELTRDESKFSGVKSLIEEGKLEIIKHDKRK